MRRILFLLLPCLLCLFALQRVEAFTMHGLSVTLDCDGFSYESFTYDIDRDNTGIGEESYQVIVTDSEANVIHLVSGSLSLNTGIGEPSGSSSYNIGTAVPGAVTYQWISLAGNGFDEQIAYSVVGYCGDPATATPTLTPTPTATPGASPTPTPTATATANYIVRATVEVGESYQDVALVYQITAGELSISIMLAAIFGVLLVMAILSARRAK